MKTLLFIKDYWTQIVFLIGAILGYVKIKEASKEATKCSLRNDILQIYDQCRTTKKITLYQLEAISLSYELYKKLKGNSFVEAVYKEVQSYEKI